MADGYSYNGWYASDDPNAVPIDTGFRVNGFPFPGGVHAGDVETVLRYVAEQFFARVEPPLTNPDTGKPGYGEWGWSFRANVNSPSQLSCHSSGTALDLNAPSHSNGTSASESFTDAQIGTMYAILDEVQGGVDWLSEYDPMHVEICVSAGTLAGIAATLPGGTSPTPTPPPSDDEDETMKLLRSDTGAMFAYAPGRFFHVASPDHLDNGIRLGLWDGNATQVSAYDLDVCRDNAIGNGSGKGDNIPVGQNPSGI